MGNKTLLSELAINGGPAVRAEPMPSRRAMGPEERKALNDALDYYEEQDADPGYQGVFEERYCEAFADTLGGGFADAVATGTLSVYVALASLNLAKNSHVLVSPVTDPGTISAITMCDLVPKLLDAKPGSYNTDAQRVLERIDEKTTAVVVVHSSGMAASIKDIVELCKQRDIKVVEDCSQAHFACLDGQPVGTFGDVAAFSTMYRKASITGSCGGVVFTKDQDIYHQVLAHADRGKPRWLDSFDDRNPANYLFPALNLHSNELSCAIGLSSLARLPQTITERRHVVSKLKEASLSSSLFSMDGCSDEDSPFIIPVYVNSQTTNYSAEEIGKMLLAEGISLNPRYAYLVREWNWVHEYLADSFACPNATEARDSSFCLYINERYAEKEIADTITAMNKIEMALCN